MLDIEIYLDILEFIHATAGGEGVQVLFCVLNRHCEASKQLVMCEDNTVKPASVQTLIFTHRYGVKNFSSMFQYYCPFRYYRCSTSAFSTVCTQSITYVCNDSCVVKNCVIPAITAEIPYFCLSKLMYEQT